MKAGDLVRWEHTYRPNGQPMPVHDVAEPGFVRLDGPQGSIVSTTLLELVESAPSEDDGLLAVIDMQMAEIDTLALDVAFAREDCEALERQLAALQREADCDDARRAGEDEGFREEVERMLGNLCIALGYDRRPRVKTGIHELDVLCRFVGDA